MFDLMELSASVESAALLDQACAPARTEAQATARRLNAIADLMRLRDRQYGDRAEWVADLWDAIVSRVDRDAIRRANKEIKDRYLNVSASMSGIAEVYGNVFASTAVALDRRLDELAGTVCEADPRTKAQRRADALAALAAGDDRMICTCGDSDSVESRGRLRNRNVVIHVVAEGASVEGGGTNAWLHCRRRRAHSARGGRRIGQIGHAATIDPS